MKQISPTLGHREIYIKTLALDKARDFADSFVQLVIDRCGAEVEETGIDIARRALEQRLAALLGLALLEFADTWTGELEKRLDIMLRMQEEKQNLTPTITLMEKPCPK